MDFSSLNPRSSNALNLAARKNDVANVRRLLQKINPNCVDNRGWTCLHEAAFNDSYESLKLILKHPDCRPLVESHEGHTALYVACQNTITNRCIKLLLKNVKDIANYGSREGFTPLHLASRQGRLDVMQMLIDYGAMIDVHDFDGDTPLHEACLGKQPAAVNLLLHAGAHPEIQNERKVTPLHIACSRGCLESVQNLLPFINDLNVKNCNNDTPLMAAVHGENEEIVQDLLSHGADPHIKNLRGQMALDLALVRGTVSIFKMFFAVTDQAELNEDIVYRALSPHCLNIEIVEVLLSSDLGPEFFMYSAPWLVKKSRIEVGNFVPTYKEFAPLNLFLSICEYIYTQSSEKFRECLFLYLMRGVSVNAVDEDELPPLVWVHYSPHSTCFEEVFEILTQHGCNVDYCTDKSISVKDLLNRKVYSHFTLNKVDEDLKNNGKAINIPDAFLVSLIVDPATLPIMIPYSLHCDPGLVLQVAQDIGMLDRITKVTLRTLVSMIDSNCECTSYETLKYYVPSLKHLCRLQVRNIIWSKDGKLKTTQEFLDIINKLPIPPLIQKYLRFL